MGKRFNNLEDVYNTLLAANFNFDSLPATNKYRKFKAWKQDPDLRKRADGAVPDSGRKQTLGLKAFGLDDNGGGADKVLVKVGLRAKNYWNSLTDKGKFFLDDTVDASYDSRTGFTPAKVILGKFGGTTSPTSKITGREYKTKIGDTYTIPFGKGTTVSNNREIDVQNLILATTTITNAHSVTFTPERISRR